MNKLIPIITLCLCSTVAKAQTEVSQYQPGVTVEGVTYFLPSTALRITVEAEKTVVTPGEFAKYAFRYLRLQDVPTEQSTTWKIKNISIEPYGTPDKTKGYSILLKGRTSAPLVSLTRDGILLSINAQKAETPLPDVPQGVAAPTLPNARDYMDQEILSAGSTAKMAELCAQKIYDVRESRNDLIQGEASNTPKDGAQLQIMLDQLDQQTDALQRLFAGSTQTSTEYFSVDFVPTKETDKQLLLRFSQIDGVVDSDDLSGSPVYISIQSTGSLPNSSQNADSDKKKAKLEKGVRYNVPAREKVTVFDADYDYCSQEVSMGQFGYVEILGESLFDKKTTTKAYFYQQNGGLEKIEQ
ncbi:MAG: DUF4831 family protein [Prevotellaceae bacterium]|nr:DUF4831 family protein [Prevotellaceae bacterium]